MRKRLGCICAALAALLTGGAIIANAADFSIQLGPETGVLTLVDREALGFAFGPPDGYLGVQRQGNAYTFFVPAKSGANCSTPTIQGTYRLGGDLTHLTDAYGCSVSLTDGAEGNVEPNGYTFDRDYSGGGPVAEISLGGQPAILLVYHGEWHPGPTCNSVPWFYGSLGLAVSTDGGTSFQSLGEIIQPYPTRAQGLGTATDCHNVHVGYGTLVLADEHGDPLPIGDRAKMSPGYYYVFYTDSDPTLTAPPCAGGVYCIAVARASRSEVIAAVAAGNTAAFPKLFKKYYCQSPAGPCGFSEPGTGQDPENAVNSGHYTPLVPVVADQPTVLFDRAIQQFLMVYQSAFQLAMQASPNLLHWSGTPLPNGTIDGSPNVLGYATLVGEGPNPAIGGLDPYLFYLNAVPPFPDWRAPGAPGTNYVSRQIHISIP